MHSDLESVEFLRIACLSSAVMASIIFVGINILISIHSASKPGSIVDFKNIMYLGLYSIVVFSITFIISFITLILKSKRAKMKRIVEKLLDLILLLSLTGWALFIVLVVVLLSPFI